MAYVTDNELGGGGQYEVPRLAARFRDLLEGFDLLIHDAMLRPGARAAPRLGSSTYEEAVALATMRVQELVLFHHEPEHGDEAMDGLVGGRGARSRNRAEESLDVVAPRKA